MFQTILKKLETKAPVVHCITNYVTANDCANVVLACGGAPIMADEALEVEEVTSVCDALVLNMGTFHASSLNTMLLAGKKANELGHPVVLDPVGVGVSKLRKEAVITLLQEVSFAVIRGNSSEMKILYEGTGSSRGVEVAEQDRVTQGQIEEGIQLAKKLSQQTKAVVVITGAIDIVADDKNAYLIRNGHPMMEKVTGTGCMLSAMIGAVVGANPEEILLCGVTAVAMMGLAGELAYEQVETQQAGTSSYRMYLIDAISKMKAPIVEGGANVEER